MRYSIYAYTIIIFLSLVPGGQAQNVRLLPCGQVQFFAEGCLPVLPNEPEHSRDKPLPPLFSKETMAPTASPLMLDLMQDPSIANAERFLAWEAARADRMREVQALLHRLQKERATP